MEEVDETNKVTHEEEKDVEEAEAEAEAGGLVWKYVYGFVETAVVKCGVELGIAETIATHGVPMTTSELSDVLGCCPDLLNRVMRVLVHQKIFKERYTSDGAKSYALTPLSRLFMRHEEGNMVDLLLFQSSPAFLAPLHHLSACVRENGPSAFVSAHGEDVWNYAKKHPKYSELLNDSMACIARVAVPAIVNGCAELFEGVNTVVDVGGGNGTTLRILVKAFPWIKGINFDLPPVVSVAPKINGVEHVGGDMFVVVPKADAVFIKRVLHNWGDDECIQILKKCREAIGKDKGKVIIVEPVISENGGNKFNHVGLMVDMVMMAQTTNGKERTEDEWGSIISQAGFSSFIVRPIDAFHFVLIAYP